jgi:hypothetical protein
MIVQRLFTRSFYTSFFTIKITNFYFLFQFTFIHVVINIGARKTAASASNRLLEYRARVITCYGLPYWLPVG